MVKGTGKLLKAGVKLGKPYALKAAEEAVDNCGVPGADIALDIVKPFLPEWLDADSTDAVAAGIKDLSNEDYNKLAELLVDVLTLAEVAAQARMDGNIDPEETEAAFDSIDELRQEAEAVLVAF